MSNRVSAARAADCAAGSIVVLKFGSSVLESAWRFTDAACEIAKEVSRGRRVVAVVSAAPGATDALLESVAALSRRPPPELVSRVVATGEAASVALMGVALSEVGIEAHLLDGEGLGIHTSGPTLDADPSHVDVERLSGLLSTRPVIVVPGFVGKDERGRLSLLGRGGSDLTALFLAHQLGAEECRLVKDVDGVYPADPRTADPSAKAFRYASWDVVLEVAGEVVQDKAVCFARDRALSFRVTALGGKGTVVGAVAEVRA
jgi:homoserine dehydrogenase